MDNPKNCLYDFARLPDDRTLISEIASASAELASKLSCLKLDSLQISDYNKRYFGRYVRDATGASEPITHLLMWAVAFHRCRREDLVVVDYGGGSGFISLLLKQLGVGTVVYSDIYDVSCRDAREIGIALGLTADHYVCGDVDALLTHLKTSSLKPNAVVSFNTIEHIYDIDGFLDKICECSTEPLSLALATSANTLNPRTNWLTMAHHRRAELHDGKGGWGHKERDTLQSFLRARSTMIQKHFPQLRPQEGKILGAKTRGLMECDIIKRVNQYVRTGDLPPDPEHSTNTCDPFTGNWAEHLMDPYKLLARIEKHGFKGQVLAGYYPRYRKWPKHCLTRALNFFIANSGSLGVRLAPHYVLYARNF